MTFQPFTDQGSNLSIGAVVKVLYKGRVGVSDRRVTRTIARETKTQIVLDDGIRFLRSNGRAVGEPLTRWGGGSCILEVKG